RAVPGQAPVAARSDPRAVPVARWDPRVAALPAPPVAARSDRQAAPPGPQGPPEPRERAPEAEAEVRVRHWRRRAARGSWPLRSRWPAPWTGLGAVGCVDRGVAWGRNYRVTAVTQV